MLISWMSEAARVLIAQRGRIRRVGKVTHLDLAWTDREHFGDGYRLLLNVKDMERLGHGGSLYIGPNRRGQIVLCTQAEYEQFIKGVDVAKAA